VPGRHVWGWFYGGQFIIPYLVGWESPCTRNGRVHLSDEQVNAHTNYRVHNTHTHTQIQTAWSTLSLWYCQQLSTEYPVRKIVFIAMGKHTQVRSTQYHIEPCIHVKHNGQHVHNTWGDKSWHWHQSMNAESCTCVHTNSSGAYLNPSKLYQLLTHTRRYLDFCLRKACNNWRCVHENHVCCFVALLWCGFVNITHFTCWQIFVWPAYNSIQWHISLWTDWFLDRIFWAAWNNTDHWRCLALFLQDSSETQSLTKGFSWVSREVQYIATNTPQRHFDLPGMEEGDSADATQRIWGLPRVSDSDSTDATHRIWGLPRVEDSDSDSGSAYATQRIWGFPRVADSDSDGGSADATQRIWGFPRVAAGCSRECIKAICGDTYLVQSQATHLGHGQGSDVRRLLFSQSNSRTSPDAKQQLGHEWGARVGTGIRKFVGAGFTPLHRAQNAANSAKIYKCPQCGESMKLGHLNFIRKIHSLYSSFFMYTLVV